MIDYLAQYDILYNYQFGFKTNHSTDLRLLSNDLCLSSFKDKLLKGFDNDLLTGRILIDFQKTFDTIKHNILLEKLQVTGFCDDTVTWFHSYLTDRAFLVSTENKHSSTSKISGDVSQGSILDPLYFYVRH